MFLLILDQQTEHTNLVVILVAVQVIEVLAVRVMTACGM